MKLDVCSEKVISALFTQLQAERRKQYGDRYMVSYEELEEDVQRFVCVRKLLSRFINGNVINARLMINHMVILGNEFGSMLLDVFDENDVEENTILRFMGWIPETSKNDDDGPILINDALTQFLNTEIGIVNSTNTPNNEVHL